MTGFSVDLAELAALAGRTRAAADDVRDDPVWLYDVDTQHWPADDPLRSAVERYQRSLRSAVQRLCAAADTVADGLTDTAEAYRGADDELARKLDRLG